MVRFYSKRNTSWVPKYCKNRKRLINDLQLQLCDTYPQSLFVPASASTIVLVGSASFRSKGRLPVLTYLHKNQVPLALQKCFSTFS